MGIEFFRNATLIELENKTGINRSSWCRYLNGKKNMKETTIQKAAIALNVSPGELLEAIYQRRQEKLDNKMNNGKLNNN